jgi:hypothetical protein
MRRKSDARLGLLETGTDEESAKSLKLCFHRKRPSEDRRKHPYLYARALRWREPLSTKNRKIGGSNTTL